MMNQLVKWAGTALLLVSMNAGADFSPRIVGGSEATPGEFPFIVSLHERGRHICGGSLIKSHWVLTAAHCVTGTNISAVYVGLHDQNKTSSAEKLTPKRIIRHPQYDSSVTDYDYALIELSSDSSYPTVEINPDEIPISDDPGKQIISTTAGWGETNQMGPIVGAAMRLQKVDVPLATSSLCSQGYPDQITDRMICAGYPAGKKDACFGDSGGPLVVKDMNTGRHVLVGLVSWGDGCARPNKLGVYSKVNAAHAWIVQNAQ